jgi:TRAP-type mannitol/chloroaromatic compound transport system permease small subunit
VISCLVAASAFQHGYFVRVDIFTKRFSGRVKLILDIWEFLFAFTFAAIVVWQGTKLFLVSLAGGELFWGGIWHPPIYPVKFFIPLAGFLLALQAVANLIRRFRVL